MFLCYALCFFTLQLGEFSNPDGEVLEMGQTFRLDLDPAKGDRTRVQLPHPEIIQASEVGHNLLIDDGKVKFTVSGKGRDYLECHVDVAGRVKDRKGVNTPDSVLDISPLTPKDRSDLEYMLSIGVDWVALSFVQTPSDIDEINVLIDAMLPAGAFRPAVMAKIEKPSCFLDDNLEKIVEKCNGIMVARGDVRLCDCPCLMAACCLRRGPGFNDGPWSTVVLTGSMLLLLFLMFCV